MLKDIRNQYLKIIDNTKEFVTNTKYWNRFYEWYKK